MRKACLVALAASFCGCQFEAGETFPLWADDAPGSEGRRFESESKGDWWVSNVHHPTLTLFRPQKHRPNGAAVVILPGGGHERLVYGPEGVEPARFLSSLGVAAFVLKYRLAKEPGSHYDILTHASIPSVRFASCAPEPRV